MGPHFSRDTLRFLRSLKRNNNRDWFKARKDEYDGCVRSPMLEVITHLAGDFRRFAPELVASPQKSMYRIYRDTRFSENKTPLKTHVAAGFPWRGLPRHEGAGLYFEVAAGWVWAGGEARRLSRVERTVSRYHPDLFAALEQEIEAEDETGAVWRFHGRAIAMAHLPSWPNNFFVDSVYRWEDLEGRVTHCTYQEAWYRKFHRRMTLR